ncbi:MAG: PASTA domain-containing protein, partial [Marmoricola sp.]
KVMDFGIARAVSDASSTMTQTAAVVGTAQYLSPEQARGETVDSRSDVYSTGCLLYELLTGRPPFIGDSPVSVAYQHVREQAQPPSAHDEEITPELDAIVMKSLAKNVGDRYPSAAAMKADIDRYLEGKPVQAPAVAAAPPPAFFPPDDPTQVAGAVPTEDEDEPDRKRRGPLILLLLLLVALVAAALIFGPQLFKAAPEQQSVPTLTGLTRDQAEQTVRDSGLQVGEVTEAASREVAQGRVISQDPQSGDLVDPDDTVDFVVSSGLPQVELPDVVGQSKDDAANQLRGEGLRVVLTQRDLDDPKDQVVEMQPPAGTEVADGSKVTLFWSDGPEVVPDVVGKTEGEATRLIEQAGFEVSRVTDATTEAEKGEVLQQSPSAGQSLDKGSTVTIVVSTYEKPPPPPSPSVSPSALPSP